VTETSDIILPILHQIQGRLTRIEERLDNVDDGQKNLGARMTGMESGLSEVNRRLDLVHVRLERLEKVKHLTETSLMENGEPFKGPDA
jgi:predicted nuclease with TOPRIM domain